MRDWKKEVGDVRKCNAFLLNLRDQLLRGRKAAMAKSSERIFLALGHLYTPMHSVGAISTQTDRSRVPASVSLHFWIVILQLGKSLPVSDLSFRA